MARVFRTGRTPYGRSARRRVELSGRPYPRGRPHDRGTQIRGRETLRDKLARKLEEHADEVVAAYLAGIRSDDPNRQQPARS
jgi:hypothetical protein